MNQERQLLGVLERKLKQRFQEIDERTLAAIRKTWESFSPSPSCRPAHEVLKEIHSICAAGLTKRKDDALTVLSETISPYPGNLSESLTSSMKKLVKELFPGNLYVACSEKTADVFKRKAAPTSKLSISSYQLEMSLIELTSTNLAARAISAANICIDEFQLQKPMAAKLGLRGKASLFWNNNWQWIIATAIAIGGLVLST